MICLKGRGSCSHGLTGAVCVVVNVDGSVGSVDSTETQLKEDAVEASSR